MTDTSEEHQVDAPAEEPTMHGARRVDALGQIVLHVAREQYVQVIKALLDDGYDVCIDLTAVDYLAFPTRTMPVGIRPERFEIVVNLLSMSARERVRLRVQVPEDDTTLPTLFDLFPGTEAMEREVYDMFGITFSDHPDLTRILMPEDWDGHPLRKDYEVGQIPVQFSSPNPGDEDARSRS
jgi:NADH-quinone oxidoreductase subunit C